MLFSTFVYSQKIDELNKKELREYASYCVFKYDSILHLKTQIKSSLDSALLSLSSLKGSLKLKSEELDSVNLFQKTLNDELFRLKNERDSLKFVSNENPLLLVKDGKIFLDDAVSSNWVDKNYFYQEDNDVYTLLSKINEDVVPSRFLDLKKIAFCLYDSSLNLHYDTISDFLFYKKLAPHFGTIEDWKNHSATNEAICSDLKEYSNSEYITSPIKNGFNYLIATKSPVPLRICENLKTINKDPLILSWITKQEATLSFQNDYKKIAPGYWWNDPNTIKNQELFQIDSLHYFGFSTLSYDGSGLLEDNPYWGVSLGFVYTITKDEIEGINIGEFWGGVELVCAFYNQDNRSPYTILKGFNNSLYLFKESKGKWSIINTVEVGYFDCPY